MKINLLLLITSMLISTMLSAQTASSIRGQVKDEKGEGIPFINIVLTQNGVLVKGSQTDFEGNYEIGPLESGFYDLEASYVGYKTTRTERIVVRKDAATEHNFQMDIEGENVDEIVIIDYRVPLVKTTPTAGQTLTAADFMHRGCGTYPIGAIPNAPRPTTPSIHDFFNEPQSSIESEKKTRLATDRDARVLKSGLPYTDPLEHVATLE